MFERLQALFSRPASPQLPDNAKSGGRESSARLSLTRSLEAGSPNRPWGAPVGTGSPFDWSGSTVAGLETTRQRSRHAFVNDQWFGNGIAGWVDAAVGTGITPNCMAPDPDFRAAAAERFSRWCDRADADGLTDFYGQQASAVQSTAVDGEALVHMGVTEAGQLSLRLLNADQLDNSMTRDLGRARIVNGIEFDTAGSRIAYWLRPQDGPNLSLALQSARVPASEVLHLFRPPFIGSIRGIPWGASVLLGLNELSQLTDSLLVGAKVAAMHCGFVVDQNSTGALPVDGTQTGSLLNASLEPGVLRVLPSGYSVQFSSPQSQHSGIEQAKLSLRGIAAGLGVPEYIVTGDLSAANYSSLRAARLAWKRRVERFQHHQLVPMLLRAVWRRWLMLEILSGRLNLRSFDGDAEAWLAVEFYGPTWESVDASKDADAEATLIAAGLKSRRQAVAERGYSVETLDAEIAADRQREASLGLDFSKPQPQQRPPQ